MVSYADPIGANHGVVCKASGCETLCAMLSQWF
jgi:hypothetical protein